MTKKKKKLKKSFSWRTNHSGREKIYSLFILVVVILCSIILISYLTSLYLDYSVSKNIVNPKKEAKEQVEEEKNISKEGCYNKEGFTWCDSVIDNKCIELLKLEGGICPGGKESEMILEEKDKESVEGEKNISKEDCFNKESFAWCDSVIDNKCIALPELEGGICPGGDKPQIAL